MSCWQLSRSWPFVRMHDSSAECSGAQATWRCTFTVDIFTFNPAAYSAIRHQQGQGDEEGGELTICFAFSTCFFCSSANCPWTLSYTSAATASSMLCIAACPSALPFSYASCTARSESIFGNVTRTCPPSASGASDSSVSMLRTVTPSTVCACVLPIVNQAKMSANSVNFTYH